MMTFVLATIVAAVLLAATTELALRQWLRRYGSWFVWQRWYRRRLELDRVVHPQLEPVIRFEINRDGERGPEAPSASDRFYRVLVAGGSAVECALLDEPSCWTGQTLALLRDPANLRRLGADAVHVGNIGRAGMDARALSMILRRVLPRYRGLDVVVLMVGPGDLVRWIESGAAPDKLPSVIAPGEAFAEHPEGPFGLSPRRWALKTSVRALLMRWLRPVEARSNAARWMGRSRQERSNAREMRESVADPTAMADNFETHLRVCLELARTSARRVVLVHQPGFRKQRYTAEEEALLWHGNVGNTYRHEGTGVFYSSGVLFQLLDLLQARAEKVARELGIQTVEAESRLEMSGRHFIDHFHFTPAGCEVLGRIVADALLDGHNGAAIVGTRALTRTGARATAAWRAPSAASPTRENPTFV